MQVHSGSWMVGAGVRFGYGTESVQGRVETTNLLLLI